MEGLIILYYYHAGPQVSVNRQKTITPGGSTEVPVDLYCVKVPPSLLCLKSIEP